MKEMHWNFWEYQHCPKFVIDQVWAFMETEVKYLESKQEEANGG